MKPYQLNATRFFCHIYIICLTLLVACSPSDKLDFQVPTAILWQPEGGEIFYTGTAIPMRMTLSDDLALQNYTIEILPIFSTALVTGSWDTIITMPIWGQKVRLNTNIDIPHSINRGDYQVKLYSTDQEGKEAFTGVANFKIINAIDSIPPEFAVQSPLVNIGDTLTTFGGGNLAFSGDLNDNMALYNYTYSIVSATDSTVVYSSPTTLTGTTATYELTEIMSLPEASGFYHLQFLIKDAVNNWWIQSYVIEIL